MSFYEGRLPAPCEDAWACVLDDRRMWFTLDSLRSDDREHTILHELGHVSSAVADPDGSLLARVPRSVCRVLYVQHSI